MASGGDDGPCKFCRRSRMSQNTMKRKYPDSNFLPFCAGENLCAACKGWLGICARGAGRRAALFSYLQAEGQNLERWQQSVVDYER
eukprot:2995618-Alexandrium_andersonii.AAC.1